MMEPEIMITGISGRFPESDSVAEFSDNLFNKVDLTTIDNRRWEPGLYGLPKKMGKLKDISKFDNEFFDVNNKQAHHLDPQVRILLELTHESILDAGYDPEELRGKNIGVFIGNCSSETDDFLTRDPKKINGHEITGCARAMFANRLSYTFDFKGPSFLMDTACSSAALALYEAVRAIQNNECEAAIVGGANLNLRPATSLQFWRLNMLSADGTCKSFDAAGDGFGRSEAIVTLFIQKSNVARRNYASIVNIRTNTDGFKEQGITYPSGEMQKRVIQEVYEECKLNPLSISYVEAHGTGTPVGDPIEMSAISDVFCSGRNEPLLVGSVKSNMGHSEPTSGLCGLVKVLIAMEKGIIPPNIHFYNPNPNIPALIDGRVKIVTEPTPWSGGYAALSCFGFGGVNVHAVLKSNPTVPEKKTEQSSIPQLVLYSGRTEESVKYLFDQLDKTAVPREFYALLHKSAYTSTAKPYRGYKLMVEEDQVISDVKQMPNEKRPVWYIFSGMGTQWPCMAKQLMNLEVFASSIKRSAEVLKPYNLDLIDLVTNGVKNEANARSIIPAFVSIAAVQVALVDVLKELGIEPDGFIGHSVGELGCAYADGCFNAEQMVLAAFWRGKAVEESHLEQGAMAALGLTWEEAKESCPKGIYPSCHNAEDSVTISGPKDSVKEYVESLKANNVFAREVDSCGYAFHSQYIYPAAGKLQDALNKVIPKPKPRSGRWISSSYPENEWSEASAKLSGASYFVHNLVSPVLFHEALHYVPKNALVIEIAPHHLLQAILKRVIGPDAEYVGLMKRNVDNTQHLLSSIGRLYSSGLNPQIQRLYPEVQMPVPRSTPMISPLIQWDHTDSWLVAKWDELSEQSQMIVEVNVGSEESADHSLLGHCIDGRCLYPATGYLVLAWKALAESKGKEMTSLPVNFEEVKIHRATVLSKTASTKFFVDITSAGGEFEISEGGMTVCTGRVYSPEDPIKIDYLNEWKKNKVPLHLKHGDIYKELKLRGYDYGPTFQGVAECDLEGNHGLLKWTGDWIVFLDTMLQFTILGSPKRALYLPTRIQSIKINPTVQEQILEETLENLQGVPIVHDKNTKCCVAGGVELKNLKATFAPKHQGKQIPILEEYHFVPYDETQTLPDSTKKTLEHYIHVCSSVAKSILEKSGKTKKQITDLINGFKEVDASVIADYLKSPGDNEILLKTLSGILSETTRKDISQLVKNYVNSYLSERDSDILSETMFGEKPLRTLLDIVLENTVSKKLKIAEVSDSPITLTSKIAQLLQAPGMVKISFALAHTKPDSITKDSLPSSNIDVVTWNMNAELTFKDVDFFVMKYLSCNKKDLKTTLENASTTLKDNGFVAIVLRTKLLPAEKFLSAVSETVIPVHSETDFEQICQESKLKVVCKKSDSLASTLYLLRKIPEVSVDDIIIPVVEFKYNKWVDQLKDELVKSSTSTEPRRVWLVSEETKSSGIIGLVNCLRQEPGGSSIRCIFTSKDAKMPTFSVTNKYYQEVVEKDLTMNVYNKGSWGTYRHLKMTEDYSKKETSHAYLNVLTRGDLSSLVWVDAPLKFFSSSEDSVLCQVYYSPLNFRDVMLASGKLPPDAIPGNLVLQDCILGLEFSGRLTSGKRVMGLVPAKGLATTVAADPSFIWDVPNEWTLEEASTVPVAYSTAYYALVVRGNLKKGDRVLIHSGSGGVGQAAIAIALSVGCEVFTTVGSSEKREYLKKRFSSLTDRNFCNSRDISFEKYILNATNGEGVDVILNSLADEKLKASLNCLAQHGRFLEIGKYDLSNNSPLGMAIFLKNISFHGILLDALFENTGYSGRVKKQVVQLVSDGIADGTVKPLNSILYNHDEAEQAFRFMASGKHIGKVVLKIRDEEPQKQAVPTPVKFTGLSRTMCNPKKSFIIIGGLGGFGLELSQWLVERGARNIILTSRSGVKSGYQQLCIQRWKQDGVNIVVSKLNVASPKETESLLKMAATHGPIGGIFNLALVLRDAFMENQTVKNFEEVGESKIQSTQNLDSLSRKLCPELEWFVCFSSVSCGRGNAGQSNYGFANSVMERICEERCQQGLPGLAIQWGAIGDVGVIEDTVGSDVVIGGTVPQRINSCLSVLDKFLQQSHPVVSSFVPFQPSETASQKSSKQNVLSTVANIFGIKDMSSINPETSLGELGMDSLIGVEVKQFLERDFDLALNIPELRQLKIKDLKNLEEGEESSDSPAAIPESKAESQSKSNPATEKTNDLTAFLQFSWNIKKQLVPTQTIVPLNAVKKGIPLFVVHPIDGTATMLESLAQNLKCPVYGVQCTPEAPSDCLENMAAWYWKKIDEKKVGKTINLAGYSFGASVAFEMAIQAERNEKQLHSKVQNVIMLDGSPAFVTAYTKLQRAHFLGNVALVGEAQALCSFALHFIHINMEELKNELMKLPSFAERIQYVAGKISAAHPSLKVEELITAMDLYNKKLNLSLQYTPKHKLNRDITLIKAADSVEIIIALSDVYDLDKVCDGKISVHSVAGSHQTFIQDKGASETSDLISKALNIGH